MNITFGGILLRASISYLYVLSLLRLSGKRSIKQLSLIKNEPSEPIQKQDIGLSG